MPRMTDERLAVIRRTIETPHGGWQKLGDGQKMGIVEELLAEIDRLRAVEKSAREAMGHLCACRTYGNMKIVCRSCHWQSENPEAK